MALRSVDAASFLFEEDISSSRASNAAAARSSTETRRPNDDALLVVVEARVDGVAGVRNPDTLVKSILLPQTHIENKTEYNLQHA